MFREVLFSPFFFFLFFLPSQKKKETVVCWQTIMWACESGGWRLLWTKKKKKWPLCCSPSLFRGSHWRAHVYKHTYSQHVEDHRPEQPSLSRPDDSTTNEKPEQRECWLSRSCSSILVVWTRIYEGERLGCFIWHFICGCQSLSDKGWANHMDLTGEVLGFRLRCSARFEHADHRAFAKA